MKCSTGERSPKPLQSLPVRGAWIEIAVCVHTGHKVMSLPVRGAWIEILMGLPLSAIERVAPRAGSVD